MTVAALRAYGARPVTVRSFDGIFEGAIVAEQLTDDAVVVMFTLKGDAGAPIVIPVDRITEVVER